MADLPADFLTGAPGRPEQIDIEPVKPGRHKARAAVAA